MSENLTDNERSQLRRFLENHFTRDELRALVFDLGVDYEKFSDNITQFVIDFIKYFENRGKLSCLVIKVMNERSNHELSNLLAKLPPCSPSVKVQVIVTGELKVSEEELITSLMLSSSNVNREDIEIIATAEGRLLIGVPEEEADVSTVSQIRDFSQEEYQIVSVDAFDHLNDSEQQAWRFIASSYQDWQRALALSVGIQREQLLDGLKSIKTALDNVEYGFKEGSGHLESQTVTEEIIRMEQIVDEILNTSNQLRSYSETQALEPSAESSFHYFAKGYGIGYDIQEIECIIQHDGSAIVQRSKKILAYSNISSLDTYLLIPEFPPTDQTREVAFMHVKSISPDREVIITDRKEDAQQLTLELSFVPPLLHGDEVHFQLIEKLPASLFAVNLNMQQIHQRMSSYDYFAWNITKPTRKLRIRVFMPESIAPDIFSAEVRYASLSGLPTDRSQSGEQERIPNPTRIIQNDRCILTLEVDHPMVGLIYMIRWEPKTVNA